MRYLRHIIAESGLTASALAEKAGLSSTTLTRPLNNPDHNFNLSRRTLDAIQAATGISFADFASADAVPPDQAGLHELLNMLTPEGREKVRQYMLFVKSQEDRP